MFLLQPNRITSTHECIPAPLIIKDTNDYNFCAPHQYLIPHSHQASINFDTMIIFPYTRTQSIVLDRLTGLQMIPRSTRRLMQNYNHQQLIDFSQPRYLCHRFNYHRKIPHVNGEYQFLPLSGTAHQNAPWLALHYVRDYELIRNHLYVTFLNDCTCTLPYKGRQIDTEIHQCAAIGQILRGCLVVCAANFGYQIELQTCFKASVIHRFDQCHCSLCQNVPTTTADVIGLLNALKVQKENYIYQAALHEYTEFTAFDIQCYVSGVKELIRKLRQL
ncbi:hypothetical protein [Latilactobacillus graminis]|uniref:ComK protein n=2 Tax=Latilactobacillus graminis TaxID=60519 RepID=A0AA89HZM4_9LACO|nr:hypothetical protein [Latilactobacillus graminis]KRM21034.1 hypothetical protein FC90_GL001569 [Latilactobacillus graminis DSM 20719]QFP79168.1 hypothetical protein LG542_02520 [Latilactobacillus graminis]